MAWGDDLITIISGASLGTYGVNLFLSVNAKIPTGDGPFTLVIETGGSGAIRTQNIVPGVSYQQPAAQIVVRARGYSIARAKAKAIYDVCNSIHNQNINGTWYSMIRTRQEPFDLQSDQDDRPRIAFNVIGFKRPS